MAHDPDLRKQLRRSYVVDRQPLKAAAALLDISYSTARSWKEQALERGDDWDRARQAEDVGDGGVKALTRLVLEEFIPLFKTTVAAIQGDKLDAVEKAEAISRLADAYAKTVKASGAVDPAIAKLAWGMDVIKLLVKFCMEHFPQHQAALVEIIEPFGEELATEFG
ncbi:DUF1804 family protein [Solimonas sp. SE-A11]|uniref:DUF1804 family protein n=1 Tax=Solimonas sp. SE-A11 TaxID=3054954 RepID=UPI00259CDA79|nr:DUF1804 family protein [Solimonas sp. SE-A11]MDM4768631.1 DUF1804 family protein [Solimonas sp. SE-A11]